MAERSRAVIDLGGPEGGRYWVVVSGHSVNHEDARAAAVHARMTGSVGATYNEARVQSLTCVTEADDRHRAIEWAEENAEDHGSVHAALVDYLFCPPEAYEDPWLDRLLDIHKFVVAQPCNCPWGDEGARCMRCELLNRRHDVYVGAGR